MLKLKNAVNSFLLTKKKFDKKKKKKKKTRRMRGGATTVKTKEEKAKEAKVAKEAIAKAKAKEEKEKKILNALEKAIFNEYNHCLNKLEDALNDGQNPKSKITFHKVLIQIPVLLRHLDQVQDKIKTINTNLKTKLIENIEKKRGFLQNKDRSLKKLITEGKLKDSDFPEGIKAVYKPESIKAASEVLILLNLFFDPDGNVKPISNIDDSIKEASSSAENKYNAFLDLVKDAKMSVPKDKKSWFSFSSNPASTPQVHADPKVVTVPQVSSGAELSAIPQVPSGAEVSSVKQISVDGPAGQVFKIGKIPYKATTDPECTTQKCVVTVEKVQSGGARKSKRSKTLKGGRRRR